MVSLLSIDQVKYQCSCGEWESLNRLYFCRHCSKIKCRLCVSGEVDSSFCPSCLDNVSTGEARQKKNRCSNCYQCPICGVGAVVRTSNETYHLSCNTCRWTTTDSDIPDSTSSTAWPEYEFEDEKLLTTFLEKMRDYAALERAERERNKYTKRRSNSTLTERYSLHAFCNRRKIINVERSKNYPSLESTDQIPELDDFLFTQEELDIGNLATLMQQAKQPLANGRPLLPVRTPLAGRHSVRCKECEHSLCKGEYSPTSVKFKIQVLAGNYVPDIRLSRRVALVGNMWCPIFLTVSNFSTNPASVVITADSVDSEFFVKCDSPLIQLSIPNKDDTLDWDEPSDKHFLEAEGPVVFQRRHRIGLRLNVYASNGVNRKLALTVKYNNSGVSFEHDGGTWLQHKVYIFLGQVNSSPEADDTVIEKS